MLFYYLSSTPACAFTFNHYKFTCICHSCTRLEHCPHKIVEIIVFGPPIVTLLITSAIYSSSLCMKCDHLAPHVNVTQPDKLYHK